MPLACHPPVAQSFTCAALLSLCRCKSHISGFLRNNLLWLLCSIWILTVGYVLLWFCMNYIIQILCCSPILSSISHLEFPSSYSSQKWGPQSFLLFSLTLPWRNHSFSQEQESPEHKIHRARLAAHPSQSSGHIFPTSSAFRDILSPS